MIETLKYATIAQIWTKNLFCLDDSTSENKEKWIKFCTDRGITYLPDKNRSKCYELIDQNFKERNLNEVQTCNPNDLIFDSSTLDKFGTKENKDNVLFVVERELIIGVVHIVDYNKDFIYYEFYKLLFQFERKLREYLKLLGQTNETFIEWVKTKAEDEKGKKDDYWQKSLSSLKIGDLGAEKKRKNLGQFQTFNFSDLLYFATEKNYFEANRQKIVDLRNWVAHSKDLVKQDKNEPFNDLGEPQPLYHFEGLKKFVDGAKELFDRFEYLESKFTERNNNTIETLI